jgi:hypothetical protein
MDSFKEKFLRLNWGNQRHIIEASEGEAMKKFNFKPGQFSALATAVLFACLALVLLVLIFVVAMH